MKVTFYPLTPNRWDDLATLFDGHSETRGCWCMWWRISLKDFNTSDRATKRQAFHARVVNGPPPGLLAYDGITPVGWVQATPRADVPRFNTSRTGKPVADAGGPDVWALSCFFIARSHRQHGLMTALARAACDWAANQGARTVEAAALDPTRPLQRADGFVGLAASLTRAGFRRVEQRTPIRVLMRWTPDAK